MQTGEHSTTTVSMRLRARSLGQSIVAEGTVDPFVQCESFAPLASSSAWWLVL